MASDSAETDWISLRPSKTSLLLTLTLPLAAAAVLFLLDLSQVVRLGLLCALLLVTVVDVYQVLQKHRGAVIAFRVRRVVVDNEPEAEDGAPPSKRGSALLIDLRQRPTAGQTSGIEITAQVLPQTYVSVYFTSVAYRLGGDPAWRRYVPRVIAVWPDALEAEAYRQVRVLLRHGG
jgi:hypothetical protein